MLITNGKGTICFMRIQQIHFYAYVVQIQSVQVLLVRFKIKIP